jgi:hypothetical protein
MIQITEGHTKVVTVEDLRFPSLCIALLPQEREPWRTETSQSFCSFNSFLTTLFYLSPTLNFFFGGGAEFELRGS